MSVGGSIVFMNIFCEAKCMKFFYGIPNQALLDWLPNTFHWKEMYECTLFYCVHEYILRSKMYEILLRHIKISKA